MKLTPLEIGRLETSLLPINGHDGSITLPIISWLIEHESGMVLFDTGMHADIQHDVSRMGRAAEAFHPDFSPGEELAARLRAVGVRPDDITHMVFSHLHFDHAGGTVEIPDARIVIQAAEWRAGHEQRLVERGVYNPNDFDQGHDVQAIDGEHDLFGDGAIRCIPTPGHTAGHQALRIELESGPVVLTGDCIYFASMLDTMSVPSFGHDTDQQLESMRLLQHLRDHEGCRLLFGHDLEQLTQLAEGDLA